MPSHTQATIVLLTWAFLLVLYAANKYWLKSRFLREPVIVHLEDGSNAPRPGTLLSRSGVLLVFCANIATLGLVFWEALSPVALNILAPVRLSVSPAVQVLGAVLFVLYSIWGLLVALYNPNYTPLYRQLRGQFYLATQGPYRLVRHPRYAAEALMNVALALFTGLWLPLLGLLGWVAVYYQARAEERALAELSDEYKEYRRRTGMFFPRIRRPVGVVLGYLLLMVLLVQLHGHTAIEYRPTGNGPDVQAQLNWIGRALREGAGEETQRWYPEGYFFAHALYGLALVDQALLEPELGERNAQELEWVLQRLEGPKGYAPFTREQAVKYGVFYQGWLNRLVGGLLLIQPEGERDPRRVEQFHRQSEALAQAFAASPTHHLEAYPGGCWPVDNVVALTSLRLHDGLYGTPYGDVVEEWLAYTRVHLDPETGLLPHRIDAQTGEIWEGARGSSLVMALSFLPELDAELARAQYTRFRELYAQPVLDFVLWREYPRGKSGPGDVDSGPLVLGLSPVSSGASLPAARANGDEEAFERLVQLSEVVGVPITLRGEKRFALGQLVAGDAFLAWGKTITPWVPGVAPYTPITYPRLTSRWYGWTNGIAVLAAVGLGMMGRGRKYRRKSCVSTDVSS